MIYPVTFCSAGVRIWVRLTPDNHGEDLSTVVRITHTIGKPAEWWTDDMYEDGGNYDLIEQVMGTSWTNDESGLGWSFTTQMHHWALTHGIAPGQPFLLEIDEPTWDCDYFGECDMDVSGGIVEIEQWPHERVLRAWQGWLKQRENYRERARKGMRELIKKRETDKNAMYISHFCYEGSGYGYGKMTSAWRLSSTHTQVKGCCKSTYPELLTERGEPGEESMVVKARLLAKAKEVYGVNPDSLRVRYC